MPQYLPPNFIDGRSSMLRLPSPVAILLSTGLVLWTFASPAAAVVVSTTSATTTRPEDDFGWDNVGILRDGTGIYLGDRWVLGAAHVGVSSVVFPGLGTFEAIASTRYQLSNPPDSRLTKPADLILFQLAEDPGLPPLDLLNTTPAVGTEVRVVGDGLGADDHLTYWDVTQRGATWTWTETSPPGDYSGLKTFWPGLLRWGSNLIEEEESFKKEFDDDILTVLVSGPTETLTLLTEFDDDASQTDDDVLTAGGSSATDYESQAVLRDSGGGMFVKVDGAWKLAGTILAVEGHRNQPDVTRTAIFGNLTYYADLATYADQIRSRVRYGDFNGDQQLTVADVDLLINAMKAGTDDRRFDLNGSGTVNQEDLEVWVDDVFVTYPGDANLDHAFDTSDLVVVLQAGNYEDNLADNATWATGDWNGDGEFSSGDLVVALQAGGYEAGPRVEQFPTGVTPLVPEPSSVWLAAAGALALACRARRGTARSLSQ
jgi:hypothetical protein